MTADSLPALRPACPLLASTLLGAALALNPLGVAASDLADVKARGKLIVVTFPLIEDSFMQVDVEAMRKLGVGLKDLRDPEHFKGIDLDLMAGFAASLGVKLEIRPELGGYGDLIPALDRREGDVAASSFAITPQRQAIAEFSTPYILQWDVAAARPDSKLRSLQDLRGKRVAVIEGSSHLERLIALNLNPTIQLTKFVLEGYTAVVDREADYTLMESRADVGEPVSAVYKDLRVVARVNETGYGIAMRKGSDLKAPLDAYLAGLRDSGELEKILSRHGQGVAAKKP